MISRHTKLKCKHCRVQIGVALKDIDEGQIVSTQNVYLNGLDEGDDIRCWNCYWLVDLKTDWNCYHTSSSGNAPPSFKVGDWVEVKERHDRWFQIGDRFQITEVKSNQVYGISPSYGLPCPFEISKDKVFSISPSGSALPGASDTKGTIKKRKGIIDWFEVEPPTTTVDKHSLAGTKDPGNHDVEFDKALKDLEGWAGVPLKKKPCECGADTIKLPFHYDWCQKYEKPGS